jgi:hypothetical protein
MLETKPGRISLSIEPRKSGATERLLNQLGQLTARRQPPVLTMKIEISRPI